MIWGVLVVLVFNVGTLIFLRVFVALPFIDSPIIPIIYCLGLFQVTVQRLYNANNDELELIIAYSNPMIRAVSRLLAVVAFVQIIYVGRHATSAFFIPLIFILYNVVVPVATLGLAFCGAVTLGLATAYMIKRVKALKIGSILG